MLTERVTTVERLNSEQAPDPVGSIALVTLAEAKAYLGIPNGDTTQDNLLLQLISVATNAIEKYCDRVFVLRRVTEIIDNRHGGSLVLQHNPVEQIISIVDDAGVTINSNDYRLNRDAGILRPKFNEPYLFALGEITVVYRAGWLLANVPEQVVHAAKEYVKVLRNDITRDPMLARERVEDVGEREYLFGSSSASEAQRIATGLHGGYVPTTVAALINPFRRRV